MNRMETWLILHASATIVPLAFKARNCNLRRCSPLTPRSTRSDILLLTTIAAYVMFRSMSSTGRRRVGFVDNNHPFQNVEVLLTSR